MPKKKSVNKKSSKKVSKKNFQTLKIKNEREIAMDFAAKVYKKFDKFAKAIILFGSTSKKTRSVGSDIDIIIVIDDASIKWDQELIAWYRQELGELTQSNPYSKNLHINTVKLTTWWRDLMRGDPIILNILRTGEPLIDLAGFFIPLKALLLQGKIKSTPEAVYANLKRAPMHYARSIAAELNAIEGLFWAMVDSSHAALISAHIMPPSPEHIPEALKEVFVDKGKLKIKYMQWYRELLTLHKEISHGKVKNIKGATIDIWQDRTDEFMGIMAKLIEVVI